MKKKEKAITTTTNIQPRKKNKKNFWASNFSLLFSNVI